MLAALSDQTIKGWNELFVIDLAGAPSPAERLILMETLRAAFADAEVVTLRGDWTRRDEDITAFLTRQGVAGVPLYLWYPATGDAEQLPQVLTEDLLRSLPARGRR